MTKLGRTLQFIWIGFYLGQTKKIHPIQGYIPLTKRKSSSSQNTEEGRSFFGIGFDRFIDVTTRNGRKDQGGTVYTQSDDLGDKFIKSFAYVLDGVKPGVITSSEKIAGALGKTTRLILQPDCDWRWLKDRKDSIWYTNVTLYRLLQDKNNSIPEIMKKISEEF